MPGPWTLDEFAELLRVPVGDVARYRDAGLLDPDGDERLNSQDVLRFQTVRREEASRDGLDGLADELASSSDPIVRALFLPKFRVEDAAKKAQMTTEMLEDYRTAFGFRLDDMDVEDVKSLALPLLLSEVGLPQEAIFEGARVYGDALSRMADAGMQITHRYLCETLEGAGHEAGDVADQLGRAWGQMSVAALETVRHLFLDFMVEAAAEHVVSHLLGRDSGAPPGTIEATIVFADLALFSSLAELEGDEAAVGLVDRTDRAIRELRGRHSGKLVKQIGDEFMLAFYDPADAVGFACALQVHLARTERDVAVRIGMHHGRLLYRLGDYYGRAVNMASRIASMAMPNSIIVTEPVAKAAAGLGIEVAEIGVRSLRGMDDPVGLYRVLPE